jgi:hypothetical protein
MVISFGIIGFLLAINFFAFWGVAPCNLVDYMSVLGENVTWAACNSLMCNDLHAFPLWFGDRESRVLCYRSESRWLDPRWRQWLFYWHKKFRSHCEPGDDSAPKRNEYQEYFLVVKTDGRKADNLPKSWALVTKSRTFNTLESSGPDQVCNGTALNLLLSLWFKVTSPRSPDGRLKWNNVNKYKKFR